MQQADEYAAYVPPDAEDVTHRAQDCDCEQCARPGQLGAERRRLARRARDERSSGKAAADRGKEGNLKAGSPFQNLQRFMAGEHAETQWPLKGADGFVRARSSGKTGAPFSHLPTGGRAGAR